MSMNFAKIFSIILKFIFNANSLFRLDDSLCKVMVDNLVVIMP